MNWSPDDVYRSNNGHGPLRACILSVSNGLATMERWPIKGGRRTRFELPVKYLKSPRCGWKPLTEKGN